MIEFPEVVTLARQMNETLAGRRITSVSIAEDRPKFMFLNENLGGYEARLPGRSITEATARGKWIFSPLDNGMILLLGEMFGRILYVPPNGDLPKKTHAIVTFDDGGRLAVTIQAWGGFHVLTPEELSDHPHVGRQGPSPTDEAFTPGRFGEILEERDAWNRKPIKAFLVHEGNVAGIGNGYLQDILFRARLSPKRRVPDIDSRERARLHRAIVDAMTEAIEQGGRDTEKDLFGNPGRYVPILDRRAKNQPCPSCGTPIEKIQYLGGSCYLCPTCQT